MAQQVYVVTGKIIARSIEYKAYAAKPARSPAEQALADGLLKNVARLEREYGEVYAIFYSNLKVHLERERLTKQ